MLLATTTDLLNRTTFRTITVEDRSGKTPTMSDIYTGQVYQPRPQEHGENGYFVFTVLVPGTYGVNRVHDHRTIKLR